MRKTFTKRKEKTNTAMGNGYVVLSDCKTINLACSCLAFQVFATVVGSLSAVTSLIFMIIPLLFSYTTVAILFAWDLILVSLWCAVFGLFGSMYMHEKAEMDPGVQRMKDAVWIDLACFALWLITSVHGAIGFFRGRKNRSLHTGRAGMSKY